MIKLIQTLLSAGVIILVTQPINAQSANTAIVSGKIKDLYSKKPIREAVVTLASNAYTGERYAVTDATGKYMFTGLPQGIYHISFEMEGYEKFKRDSIPIAEGMSLVFNYPIVRKNSKKKKLASIPGVIEIKEDVE